MRYDDLRPHASPLARPRPSWRAWWADKRRRFVVFWRADWGRR